MVRKQDSTIFMEITNRDIYDTLMTLKKENKAQHDTIILHQERTNGKVRTNRWIATTALTVIIAIVINIII